MASPSQSPTSAWTQSLRRDVRDCEDSELARVAHVGFVMATFANADGSSIKPSQELLAKLTARSVEAVSRSIKIMIAGGILRAKRRPNQATEYQLLIPTTAPDWAVVLAEFGQSRHRERYQRKKMAALESGETQGPESVETRSPDSEFPGVPDPEFPGVPHASDYEFARVGTTSFPRVRTPSFPGGTMTDLPPVATSTEDLDTPPLSPQQPVRAGARAANNDSSSAGAWRECPGCGGRMYDRPGRKVCGACVAESR